MSDVELRTGPWYSGNRHSEAQHCVDEVDIDINPDSPYTPKRLPAAKPDSARPQKRPSKPRG